MANQSKYLAFSFWTKSVNEKEIFIVVVPINEKQSQEKNRELAAQTDPTFLILFAPNKVSDMNTLVDS